MNTNDDEGAGSLRQAIEDANGTAEADRIVFDLGLQDRVIQPATPLPPIIHPVTIDGTTQPGFVKTPLVVINGGQIPDQTFRSGFEINTTDTTIRGLVINGFKDGAGILIGDFETTGVASNHVENCYIGLDATGATAVPNAIGVQIGNGAKNNVIGGTGGQGNVIAGNARYGVAVGDKGTTGNQIQGNFLGVSADKTKGVGNGYGVVIGLGASNNTIGGLVTGAGNLISGNVDYGIALSNSGTTGNLVQGNLIGTNAAGDQPLGNFTDVAGIAIFDGAQGNLIGGTATGARNVIAGVSGHAVSISDKATSANIVQGNILGLDATGTKLIGFGNIGVTITDSPLNVIGGAASGAGNVISGGGEHGIRILGLNSKGNKVQGNRIGTGADGTTAFPNGDTGIQIDQAPDNVIGGRNAGEGNLIAFNANSGVVIIGNGAQGNTLVGNLVHFNGNSEVDLNADDQTANDNQDADTGPNGLQNFPILASANSFAGSTTIQGTLNSTPSASFTIDFYSSAANDDNNLGQSEKYLGSQTVTTNSSGVAVIVAKLAVDVAKGDVITAMATDNKGGTSEFSQSVATSNDPSFDPVLTLSGTPVSYKLKAAAVVLDETATLTEFSDPGAPNFNGAKLTVKLNPVGASTETLAIRKQKKGAGQITLSGKKVQYGGVTIGTYVGGKGKLSLVVTFSDKVTIGAVQALVRNITYANKAKSATTPTRTVEFDITHKNGRTTGLQSKTIAFVK